MRKRYWLLILALALVTVGCLGGGSMVTQFTLTMEIQGEGTVDPAVGSRTYAKDSLVTLTADPAEGWGFVRWEGEVQDTHALQTQVLMDEEKTITAVFVFVHPFGADVPIDGIEPMRFEDGTIIDFTALDIPDGTTVSVEDVSGKVDYPQEMILSGSVVFIAFSAPLDVSPCVLGTLGRRRGPRTGRQERE